MTGSWRSFWGLFIAAMAVAAYVSGALGSPVGKALGVAAPTPTSEVTALRLCRDAEAPSAECRDTWRRVRARFLGAPR